MAVSGRKISDFKGSESKSSAEDFEYSCVPCLSEDQHIEARVFCVECQEYLCQNCFHYHKKLKVSRHHQLRDIDKIDQHVSTGKMFDVCTEICPTHSNEVIKFFCPEHEELGCHDCMTLSHRTCNLDYIPDVCVGVSDSREYQDTLKNLDHKMKEADDVIKRGECKTKEIDAWYDDVIKDVERIRKEINDHLDTIEKKMKEDAKKRRSRDKQEIKTLLESYTNFSSDLKKLKFNLKDLKEQNKNSDVFITLKRVKSKLESTGMRCETVLDKNSKLLFECHKALENILLVDCFGKLTEHTTDVITNPSMLVRPAKPVTPSSGKIQLSSLSHKADINIKTNSDREPCYISGCAVLSPDKLILADHDNNKLKVVNTVTKAVVEEKQLDSRPWDVTVLPEDQIAVTVLGMGEIRIMRTTGQLATSCSIKVQGFCKGITYNHDRLYVVCVNPNCVLVLDIKDEIMNTIPLTDERAFSSPRYIEVSKDNKLLYISDSVSNSVVSVTLQGEITAVNKDIIGPRGLVILDDGSVLVCGYSTGSIYRLSTDFKQSFKLMPVLARPQLICCSPEKRELYVGGDCDLLKVFSLQ